MPGDMVRAAADAVEQAGSVCRNKCCTSSFPVFVCQCQQSAKDEVNDATSTVVHKAQEKSCAVKSNPSLVFFTCPA